jgi:arylsulfatase A-like enzyme
VGAVLGVVAGVLDAAFSGASEVALVAAYDAAFGCVAGALLGALTGAAWGIRTRPSNRVVADKSLRTLRAATWFLAAAFLMLTLSRVGAIFGSTFRNRELAALTFVVSALGAAACAVFVALAIVGVVERAVGRFPATRREAWLRRFPFFAGAFLVATLGFELWLGRDSIEERDLRLALLASGWMAMFTLGVPRLVRRGFRLSSLPWIVRRLALVACLVAGYATFQLVTGGSPRAVAGARTLVSLPGALIPTPEDAAAAAPESPALAKTKADTVMTASGPTSGARVAAPAASVLLITISSARRDHFSLYGYARPTSAKLDAFAKRCAVFERAYAASSAERDAMASLLAGSLPSRLKRSAAPWPRLLPGNRLLAEELARAGVRTGAVVSHAALGKSSGLAAGFATFDTSAVALARTAPPAKPRLAPGASPRRFPAAKTRSSRERQGGAERVLLVGVTSPAVTARTKVLLEGAQSAPETFFLWAHYSDPHAAYIAHDEHSFGRRTLDRYDGELAFTDSHIGDLLAAAEKVASSRPLYIIVVGDHGEALGEGGRRGHGRSLADAEVRVPLVVCGPGVRAARVESPVSVLDLYPTVLELSGIEPAKRIVGRSLRGVLRGEAADGERFVPMEIAATAGRLGAAALVSRDDKLVLIGAGNHPRLFDLRSDPLERRNVAARRPDRVRKMQIELHRLRGAEGSVAGAASGRRGVRRVISASDDAAEQEALRRAWDRQKKMQDLP